MATIILILTVKSFIFLAFFGVIGGLVLSFLLALAEEKKTIHSFNFFTLLTTKKGKGRRTITTKKQAERVLKPPAIVSFESPKVPSSITSNKTRIKTNLLLLLIVENIWVFSEV